MAKKGKSGEPKMPAKSTESDTRKTKSGRRGGPRTELNELQKVLLVGGGIVHRHRALSKSSRMGAPKRRKTRADKKAA